MTRRLQKVAVDGQLTVPLAGAVEYGVRDRGGHWHKRGLAGTAGGRARVADELDVDGWRVSRAG
jgi:hypothetical protein